MIADASFTKQQTGLQSLLYIGENSIHICATMVGHGYTGLTFKSLRKAAEWLHHRAEEHQPLPQAVICDDYFGAPGLKKFIAELRENKALKNLPVVLLTEKLDKVSRCKAVLAAADDVHDYQLKAEDLAFRIVSLRKAKALADKRKVAEGMDPANDRVPLSPQPADWLVRASSVAKRLIDIAAASVGLVLLSPLLLIVAVLIKLDSKGPVFYISKRVGRNYRVFDFYKFRSMRTDADKMVGQLAHLNQYEGPKDGNKKAAGFVKIANDPRVTELGRFLRNTSIDELPQLFNILKGDMSLVGNRPLPVYEAKTLTQDQWAMRFLAPAGLTGLWQVSKRGKGGDMSVEERMQLDIQYAREHNIVKDIELILRTFPALVQKENV